jgi:hypothetical protein
MGEPNSTAFIFIDYSGGNYQLFRVKDCEEDVDRTLEVRKAVGVKGGVGFKKSIGGGGLTLTVYRESPTPEVDWRRLDERFALTFQDEDNGPRNQYQGCEVEKVTWSLDSDGEYVDKVSIKFLRGPVPLPPKQAA